MQRLRAHEQLTGASRRAPVDHGGSQVSLHEGDGQRVDAETLEVDLDDGPGRGTPDVVVGAERGDDELADVGERRGAGLDVPGPAVERRGVEDPLQARPEAQGGDEQCDGEREADDGALHRDRAECPGPGARPKLTPTDAAGAAPLRGHPLRHPGRPARALRGRGGPGRVRRRIAGHRVSSGIPTRTHATPMRDHRDVEGEAGVRVRFAGEADDAERREQRRDPAREDRRGDRHDRGPERRERDELTGRHPEGPERAVVPGLDPDLAGDGLLHQHQEGEQHDDAEDPERGRLHPDRPLHPGRTAWPGS